MKVLNQETAARLKVYVDTCVHCGLCSNACHWYNSHDGDPKYAPVSKVKDTLWEMIKKKGKVDAEFIRRAARIAFTECNVCRRCSMYCPFGIDLAYLLLTVRRICHLLGVVPQYLQDTVNSHAATLNQMWVKPDEWIDTLQWQEEEQLDELVGARIPLDREGADIMYSVIGPEPKFLPQLIGQMNQIMTVAGMSWTMPSLDGWDNSNMAMYSGDFEVMARVERKHYDKALELKVKKIVMGECGHAFRGAAYDGPKWLGWKHPPVPLIHAVEFYHDLIASGKIKIAKKYRGADHGSGPVQHRPGKRTGEEAPLHHERLLFGLPGCGAEVRAQLLLCSRGRCDQLRAAVEGEPGERKPGQGGPVQGDRGQGDRYALPQLPQRYRGYRFRLQARHAREVLLRDPRGVHGDS